MKRILAVLAFAAVVLAGCSGGSKPAPASPATTTATAGQPSSESTAQTCPVSNIACDKAAEFATAIALSDWDVIFRNVQAEPAACPGPTAGGLGGPYPLCDGAAPGELRHGFRVAHHGSEGVMLNAADFRTEVIRAVGDPRTLRVVSIGCPKNGPCEQFVVVFETAQPQVVYFVFDARRVPDKAPSAGLAGFGISGDNAMDILAGRDTWTAIGETRFAAYAPSSVAPASTPGAAATLDVKGRKVPLHQAIIGQPLTAPRSLSIVVTHGCSGCDSPDMAIERVTWDASGTMRSETLFSAKDRGGSYITGIGATPDGSVLVAGVCVRSYCGPMGSDFFPDSRVTVFRSLDGGVSWTELATVSGYAFPLGVASDGQAIVLRRESATSSFMAKLPSGDRFVSPPAAAISDWPQVIGGQPYWNPASGSTLVSPVGDWPLDVPPGSTDPRVVTWGRGGALYQWSDGHGAYVGDPYEDGFLRIAWKVPSIDLEIRTWPHNTSLLGDALFDRGRLPVFIHQGPDPSELTIQAVDAPVFPPDDRNKVVAGMAGPIVRVSGTGDCLRVRSTPSTSASQLGCYKDGVLFTDLGETTVAEGLTWVKVMTPTPPDDWVGQQGWASAEFLVK